MNSTTPALRSRRGPRSSGDSRGDILAAARSLFAAKGFRATTMRDVAASAAVDASLIHHYFGTKAELFQAALDLPRLAAGVAARLAAPSGDVAEGFARLYLEHFFTTEVATFSAMLRTALGSPGDVPQLRRIVEESMLRVAVQELGGPDAALRAELAAAQMIGIFILRHLIGVPPIATATTDELLRHLVPALQTVFEAREES